MRRPALVLCTLLLSFVAATPTSAQVYVFGGGGFTVPASTFSEIASGGWMSTAGLMFPLREGFLLGGQGFYGRNDDRDVEGARTTLMGAMGLVYKTFLPPEGPTPFASLGFGYMKASFTSPIGDADSSSPAMSAGVGVEVPLGAIRGFLSGAYTWGFGDIDDVRYMAVNVGLSIPIGGGM